MDQKRKEFEMSQAQAEAILEQSYVPEIAPHCYPINSQQDRAPDAWADLGREMGFDSMTVKRVPGKGLRCFTAEVR